MEAKKIEVVNQIVEYNEFEAKLVKFKAQYEGVVYDLTDPDKEREAKADKLSIGKVLASLDRVHDAVKAPLKEKTDLIDSERKRIKDDLLAVQSGIKDQLAEHEKKIADHAEMLGDKVQAISSLAANLSGTSAEYIAERLKEATDVAVDDTFEFRKADAALAKQEAVETIKAFHVAQVKYEAEQAELEKLRLEKERREQAERDEHIRTEAAEQAKRQAEDAANKKIADALVEKLAAEQRAEDAIKREAAAIKLAEDEAKQKILDDQKQASEAKAREVKAAEDAEKAKQDAVKAEREKVEREQREAQAKKDAAQKVEDAKKSKQAHRAKVHKEIKNSFRALDFTDEMATRIVTVIKDELVNKVKIEY